MATTAVIVIGLALIALAIWSRDRLHSSHAYFRLERTIRRYPVATAFVLLAAAYAYGQYQDGRAREHSRMEGQKADYAACLRDDAQYAVFRNLIERSQKNLPTLRYYRENPDELRKAQAQNRATLEAFAPILCEPVLDGEPAGQVGQNKGPKSDRSFP